MSKRIRVAVLTQEDSFVIPENIRVLAEMDGIDLVAVVNLKASGSLVNKKSFFLNGFGVYQCAKMGCLTIGNRLLDLIDALFVYKLRLFRSLRSTSVVYNAEYNVMTNPNDGENIRWIKALQPDLIVSFSAPCVFKPELLHLPRFGCINLHCSLLPKYAGLLPSFWALYENSDSYGATVHEMDHKIDNGCILGQVEVPRPFPPSMFNVIKNTKKAGGLLMVRVVKEILSGSSVRRQNDTNADDNYSWPTVAQIKQFRRRGGRLI